MKKIIKKRLKKIGSALNVGVLIIGSIVIPIYIQSKNNLIEKKDNELQNIKYDQSKINTLFNNLFGKDGLLDKIYPRSQDKYNVIKKLSNNDSIHLQATIAKLKSEIREKIEKINKVEYLNSEIDSLAGGAIALLENPNRFIHKKSQNIKWDHLRNTAKTYDINVPHWKPFSKYMKKDGLTYVVDDDKKPKTDKEWLILFLAFQIQGIKMEK